MINFFDLFVEVDWVFIIIIKFFMNLNQYNFLIVHFN